MEGLVAALHGRKGAGKEVMAIEIFGSLDIGDDIPDMLREVTSSIWWDGWREADGEGEGEGDEPKFYDPVELSDDDEAYMLSEGELLLTDLFDIMIAYAILDLATIRRVTKIEWKAGRSVTSQSTPSTSTSTMAYHPILTQHFDTSATAFTKIDNEIVVLQDTIRSLYTFRNTFCTVNRLSPEILTRIFSFVQCAYSNTERALGWLDVTCVSHHWRNVVLECPRLWSHISSTYPKRLAAECITRSKAASLSLDLRGTGPHEQLITPLLFRTRELSLQLDSTSWNSLSSKLSSPAPLLQSLTIMITENARGSPYPIIPDTMFGGVAPHLQCLDLIGCSFDINLPLLARLTALELDCLSNLSATDFLTTLRGVPHLTSLSLLRLPNDDVLASPNLDAITLSSLRTLSIRGISFTHDLDLLSHLSFPANTAIYFYSVMKSGESIASLSAFMATQNVARLQESNPPFQTSVELWCLEDRLRLFIDAGYHESRSTTSLLVFDLFGQWDCPSQMPDKPETTIFFTSLPLLSLTSFTAIGCNIGAEIWTDIFGSLPKLKRISASGVWTCNLLSAIVNNFMTKCPAPYVDWDKDHQQDDWEVIFPHLEELHLQKTFLPTWTPTDLMDALRARKIIGKEIKLIKIMECPNVSRDILDELGRCVGEISWDGWTGPGR
ncbi:hypothetical protein BDN72DRAFT_880904 [Pluteus cervinus]|uniref:Uncharacterized protein n=1 Tax=Pluteus cervinus TaxID=181527 RepID=A0ACD3AIV6_9AGAR|nr:hypothetical protein BDN72DRAFT_880904 [Pluteus cervinus]